MNCITKDELERLYLIERLPMWKIGKITGIATGKIHKLIHQYGIPARTKGAGMLGKQHNEEARRKISNAHKGMNHTQESREKMSEARLLKGIGHKKERSDGYVAIYFPDHPKANNDGYIMEHDLVMECVIGRWLNEDECVHHINEIRNDNRKENLQIMTKSEHMAYHAKKRWLKKKGELTY
jgi:hypothetical protein